MSKQQPVKANPETINLVRALAFHLSAALSRRVTMGEVVDASVQIADRNQDRLRAVIEIDHAAKVTP